MMISYEANTMSVQLFQSIDKSGFTIKHVNNSNCNYLKDKPINNQQRILTQ